MGIDEKLARNLKEGDHQPHLSGAYIRSLVKQLTSSRPKTISTKQLKNNSGKNMSTNFSGEIPSSHETQQPQKTKPLQQQHHKKQVRRRLHTSRPYQERLLNMAEARREIVTALKFHRAAMKQANEQKQQQQHEQQQQQNLSLQQQQLSQASPSCFEQEPKLKSRRNPRIYPSNTTNFYNNINNNNTLCYAPIPQAPYPIWCNTTQSIMPLSDQNLQNFPLPNQTLGLNLNLHDFNIETSSIYQNNNRPTSSSTYSSNSSTLSPSSSSSPPPTIIPTNKIDQFHDQELVNMKPMMMHHHHQVMDEEQMAEMRSIGEQHQMEWNDKMNLVTSAWWVKFLQSMEIGNDNGINYKKEDDNYNYQNPFEEVMEFPSWLSPNDDTCFDQPHFDDYCSPDYYKDPALPCMDIGEFEGMDGDWLA